MQHENLQELLWFVVPPCFNKSFSEARTRFEGQESITSCKK